MDTRETASAALQLLERVDLKGSEVPAFLEVNQLLGKLANGDLVVVTVEDE